MTTEPKKILIVQTGFIGDMILSTPVISELKERFSNSKLYLLTTPQSAVLFQNDSRLDEVLTFDKRGKYRGIFGLVKFAQIIKTYDFDVVYSLHKSYRTAVLLYLSKIKKRFGFKEAKLNILYSAVTTRSEYEHDAIRNLAILKHIGIDPAKCNKPLSINIAESIVAELELKYPIINENYVVVAPGSVWATKRWTENGFSELVSGLLDKGHRVVLIGGPDDIQLGHNITNNINVNPNLHNLIGKLSLIESAAFISKARVAVTNDSSPLHLASASQIPVVSIFCATVPEFGFGPWMTKHKVIEVKNLECRPCGRHGGNSCPTGTHYCQNKIRSQEVLSAVEEMLLA